MKQNIFTDYVYLSSSATNSPDPSINFHNNYVPVIENNSSTRKVDFSVLKPILCITGDQVYPFPTAKPCTSKRGSRKPSRCRILIETLEQYNIEIQCEIKMTKRKRKLVKKSFILIDI